MHHLPGLVRNSSENGLAQHLSQPQMLRRALRPGVLVQEPVPCSITLGLFSATNTAVGDLVLWLAKPPRDINDTARD